MAAADVPTMIYCSSRMDELFRRLEYERKSNKMLRGEFRHKVGKEYSSHVKMANKVLENRKDRDLRREDHRYQNHGQQHILHEINMMKRFAAGLNEKSKNFDEIEFQKSRHTSVRTGLHRTRDIKTVSLCISSADVTEKHALQMGFVPESLQGPISNTSYTSFQRLASSLSPKSSPRPISRLSHKSFQMPMSSISLKSSQKSKSSISKRTQRPMSAMSPKTSERAMSTASPKRLQRPARTMSPKRLQRTVSSIAETMLLSKTFATKAIIPKIERERSACNPHDRTYCEARSFRALKKPP